MSSAAAPAKPAAKPAAPAAAGSGKNKKKKLARAAAGKRVPRSKAAAKPGARAAAPAATKEVKAAPKELDEKTVISTLAAAIPNTKGVETNPELHSGVLNLFANLTLSPSATAALIEAAKAKGVTLVKLQHSEFETLPASVPRPRGPSGFFHMTNADGKKYFLVVADGAPYLFYAAV